MPPADDSDRDLVERANSGDADAFEALYRRHRDWAVALAYRFTGDREDALDVLQEAFTYLFGKFPGFDLTASLHSFLYPTIKHLSLDRRRRRRPTVDVEEVGDEIPIAAAPESDAAVARAVGELSAAHREVVLLRFVDDMSLEQIAAAVDAPVGTVKSRLHHAISALRERLRRT